MGGCIWNFFCDGCCDYACCDPKDDWNVTDEIRAGEHAAGFVYKRAKNSAVWSKRYCSVTDHKLVYYMERDRLVMKGEIVLAGSTVDESATRAHTRNQWFFTITHPQCGTRELYARTRKRRSQWIEKISYVCSEVTKRAVYGKLKKLGGSSKNIWQERWCICTGRYLDYFELPTDNQAKGSIDLLNSSVREFETKGKLQVEIIPAPSKKMKNKEKKYVFQFDNEFDQARWLKVLELGTKPLVLGGDDHANPMHSNSNNTVNNNNNEEDNYSSEYNMDTRDSSISEVDLDRPSMIRTLSSSGVRISENAKPTDKCGYLMKKSPALFKGWQKRYFKTLDTGDIEYYKTENDANNDNMEPQGVIQLKTIKRDVGLEVDDQTHQITIHTNLKSIHLKANNHNDALSWVSSIAAWIDATTKVTFDNTYIEMGNKNDKYSEDD